MHRLPNGSGKGSPCLSFVFRQLWHSIWEHPKRNIWLHSIGAQYYKWHYTLSNLHHLVPSSLQAAKSWVLSKYSSAWEYTMLQSVHCRTTLHDLVVVGQMQNELVIMVIYRPPSQYYPWFQYIFYPGDQRVRRWVEVKMRMHQRNYIRKVTGKGPFCCRILQTSTAQIDWTIR